MKTNKLITAILLSFAMFLSACLDVEVKTVLNKDGSIDRIVEVNSDSELKNFAEIPFPVDSTWNIDYQIDSTRTDKKKHIYVFKKHYENASELTADYNDSSDLLGKYNREVKVEKNFRWFYTYFTYEEKYDKLVTGSYRPFSQYLSDIEKEIRKLDNMDTINQVLDIDTLKIKSFKKGIEEKFEKWFEDNLKEEIIIAIDKDMKDNKVTAISRTELEQNSDTIYKLVDSLFNTNIHKSFYTALNKLFNTTEFDKIISAEHSNLSELGETIEYVISQRNFKYCLQMPGLLLDTNTDNIKGNQLYWQFEPIEACFVDTSHYAKSRVINVWAFVVSGAFLVVVIILLLVPVFKKKK